jgi:hypothetical protein
MPPWVPAALISEQTSAQLPRQCGASAHEAANCGPNQSASCGWRGHLLPKGLLHGIRRNSRVSSLRRCRKLRCRCPRGLRHRPIDRLSSLSRAPDPSKKTNIGEREIKLTGYATARPRLSNPGWRWLQIAGSRPLPASARRGRRDPSAIIRPAIGARSCAILKFSLS